MYLLAVTRDNRRFVHVDRVGDGLEIERPQMLHAVRKERVLLTHDLGRHFEDGLGALIERANEPGRGLQTIGEIALVGLFLGGAGTCAKYVWLTSTFGKVSELSSTRKPPSGPGRTKTSGTIGCTTVVPKARPGFGLR